MGYAQVYRGSYSDSSMKEFRENRIPKAGYFAVVSLSYGWLFQFLNKHVLESPVVHKPFISRQIILKRPWNQPGVGIPAEPPNWYWNMPQGPQYLGSYPLGPLGQRKSRGWVEICRHATIPAEATPATKHCGRHVALAVLAWSVRDPKGYHWYHWWCQFGMAKLVNISN